jgi:ketosteroid isomerase-like protein
MDQSDDASILTGAITDYMAAWNSGDLTAIVDAYTTPCFVVKGGRVLRHNDEAAKRRYFEELLSSNQDQGPHIWSIGDLDMHPLGRDATMITVRWIARRPDRSLLWDFLDSYLMQSRTVARESWVTSST